MCAAIHTRRRRLPETQTDFAANHLVRCWIRWLKEQTVSVFSSSLSCVNMCWSCVATHILQPNIKINNIYALCGQFIRHHSLVLSYTCLCTSSRHRFNTLLETFFRYFGPCWHDIITVAADLLFWHLLNLPFHQISTVLYQFEIIWAFRSLLKECRRRSVHCGGKGMEMVSNSS